jgi:hypothetical protein
MLPSSINFRPLLPLPPLPGLGLLTVQPMLSTLQALLYLPKPAISPLPNWL